MYVLEQSWECRFLKRLLKIFISKGEIGRSKRSIVSRRRRLEPPDKLVENLYVFLYVVHLRGFFRIEYSERRRRRSIVNEAATWLQKTADKDDLE